nr:copia protein [Tanacetum cinerariifolium]
MEIKDKLDLDQNGTLVDARKYRSMIGALMYLTSSRPNIVHATCLCARYQAKPTEKHLKEVKRIFRYLRGTVNTSLWYTKDSGFELTGFSDADYAGCKDSFRSTSGGTQFLGEKLVSWSLKKQDCTALSTAEAEYVSLSACCAQVFWMQTQLKDYGFIFKKIPIYCDLKSAIDISCNPVQHSRTKHIAVHYHFIKEHVEKGTIKLYFVKTDYQLADIFTKALPTDRFNYLVRRLGMRDLSPQELERLAKSHIHRFFITWGSSKQAKEPGMIKYIDKVKNQASTFKEFSIKQVPKGENKKASKLSKMASTSFAHLSKQVLVEELKEKLIDEKEVLTILEEEGHTWMTPIYEYLTEKILPEEKRKANYVLREIYEGSCSMYSDPSIRFRTGGLVYQKNEASRAEDRGKLGPKWEGPYEVTKALGKGAYNISDHNGNTLSRTWNVCNLKKFYTHEM